MKRFRGQKRYYRNLKQSNPFKERDFSTWYNFYHYHTDRKGYGNISWKHRIQHLDKTIEHFEYIKHRLCSVDKEFQIFGIIDLKDSSQDAIYIHTKNPHSNFPFHPPKYKLDFNFKNPLKSYIKKLPYTFYYQKLEYPEETIENVVFFDNKAGIPLI